MKEQTTELRTAEELESKLERSLVAPQVQTREAMMASL
jgi:hypothetical protein